MTRSSAGRWRILGAAVLALAVSSFWILALRSADAFAGQGLAASEVATGKYHSCAASPLGTLACWGTNASGQLGNGTTATSRIPVAVLSGGRAIGGVTDVTAAHLQTCAVVSGGAMCWGGNKRGQLGDGTLRTRATPGWVYGLGAHSGVSAISTGFLTSCAIVGGGAECWGAGLNGQLGDGTTSVQRARPAGVWGLGSHVSAISVASQHTCAVVAGGAQCWGLNSSYGMIGDGTTTRRLKPVSVVGLGAGSGVTAIATGSAHTCAVVNGGVECWGRNDRGQLGDGAPANSKTPVVAIPAGSGATAIAAGDRHSCAVVLGGVFCWGGNRYGQLGSGNTLDSRRPLTVLPPGSGATAIAAGVNSSCAAVNGSAVCWGSNRFGQLGNGLRQSELRPFDVARRPVLRITSPADGYRTNAPMVAIWFTVSGDPAPVCRTQGRLQNGFAAPLLDYGLNVATITCKNIAGTATASRVIVRTGGPGDPFAALRPVLRSVPKHIHRGRTVKFRAICAVPCRIVPHLRIGKRHVAGLRQLRLPAGSRRIWYRFSHHVDRQVWRALRRNHRVSHKHRKHVVLTLLTRSVAGHGGHASVRIH